MNIILASGSQRRRELMNLMGLEFEIIPSGADENINGNTEPSAYVKELALRKAEYVANEHKSSCVVGSDTIVVLDGNIIGKPKDEMEAYRILRSLSGRTHTVYTGLAVVCGDRKLIEYDETKVTFCELSDDEIYAYIKTGDPMDKAGAYGIQGRFCVNIERIEGSYFTVIGLPVHILNRMLKRLAD